jgi:enoyl-[acyl-carrier protein] reductase III
MSAELFSLHGKRMLVTGGTRGIGRAITRRFVLAGADVVAGHVRDDQAAESLRAELAAQPSQLTICRADLTTESGRRRLLEALGVGTISGLVHSAATGVHRPLQELTERHWDFTFALNVKAFFELVKALLPQMCAGSTIVALSSQGAVQAVPNYSLVGATKGALESLCRHWAIELAPRGIRVNVLSAGSVLTDAWDAFPDKQFQLDQALKRSSDGRLTTAEEVAQAAQFLCSDASSGVTGHTLVVDGGQRIQG